MWTLHRDKLQLLFSIEEMLDAAQAGVILNEENWRDIREALGSLGLPPANIMYELLGRDIQTLRRYLARFIDAQTAAAAHSAKMCSAGSADNAGAYGCDREFQGYMQLLRDRPESAIAASVYAHLRQLRETNPADYHLITEGSRGWYFEGNRLDGVDGANNSLITHRVAILRNHRPKLEWLYDNLADALSRRTLNAIIKYWLTWDSGDCKNVALYGTDVVDTGIYPFYDDEVFVDCGSYIGDTVLQYVNVVNQAYARMYTYDISRASIELIKQNLAALPNVVVRHRGTGEKNAMMDMVGFDGAFHGNKLSEGGGNAVDHVQVVRLDDDIQEPITFLKVDCEGMDKETLRGARGLIQKYHPKLHVDSYHKLGDIVDVPWLIRDIDPSYTLYLRVISQLDMPFRFPFPAYMAV